jgi:hypothetical protein
VSEPLSLDLLPRAVVRRRAVIVSCVAVVFGAAVGGVVGLVGGRLPGIVAATVAAVPLLVLAVAESRRRSWLRDGVVSVRALGTRSVDLRAAKGIELLVTEVRGSRAVGLLVTGPPKGRTINVAVATYAATGGRELDIVALRRLADGLAGGCEADGLVFAELLVAQLRAEARGAAGADRPLYRIAATAPGGRIAHRIRPDAVSRFVAPLD